MGIEELRNNVRKLKEQGISERKASLMIGLCRSSLHYEKSPSHGDPIRDVIRGMAMKHKRYGYRRVTAMIRREGRLINHKRVYRIWKEEGLKLPRKRHKKRRLWILSDRPMPATRPNEVWSYDFTFDRTVFGEPLKMLVVIDEYSRECLRVHVGRSITSEGVRGILEELMRRYGKPRYIRSDNGPEFIAEKIRKWLLVRRVRPIYIEPGHPWENGFVESFNGKLKDECLNAELFWSKEEAQIIVERYRREYNEKRPHMALGYRTPAEVGLRSADPAAGLN